MHASHRGGQSYKQRPLAREVLALPTSHSVPPATVGTPRLAPFASVPPHPRPALSFSATCRQRAPRHWQSTHSQTPQGRAAAYQHTCQRQHRHDTCPQVALPECPRSKINHHTTPLVRLDTRFHVGSCRRIPVRARCEQPGDTGLHDPTNIRKPNAPCMFGTKTHLDPLTAGSSAPIPVGLASSVSIDPVPVGMGTPSASTFCTL